MNENLLTIFIAVTAVAVVLQMVILFALYLATKKTAQRVEDIAKRVEEEALPTIAKVRTLVTDNAPKIEQVIADVSATTTVVKQQSERIGAMLDDMVDRTRLQTVRADEMVSRAFDRIEETTETMQNIVVTPMRHMTGIMNGVMAGISEFVGGRRVRRQERAVPKEDMFI